MLTTVNWKKLIASAVLALTLACGMAPSARAAGTWTTLTNAPPETIGLMLVLTDGRIMAQGTQDNTWYALTPDATGSYANGTWSTLAPMQYQRLFFTSQVLQNGDVLIAGGEYSNSSGTFKSDFTNTCEIYHTKTNTWGAVPTPTYPDGSEWADIGDSVAHTLPNGTVLLGNLFASPTALYDYTTNTWTPSAQPLNGGTDEESWALLPNGSVLAVNTLNTPPAGHNTAERYLPSSDTWVQAGKTPDVLVESSSAEIGPGMLLPSGSVLFAGATGHCALYAASSGVWSLAPNLIGNDTTTLLAMKDAPGCVEVNGKALLLAAPNGDGSAGDYPTGQHFLEYTPDANGGSLVEVAHPATAAGYSTNNPAYVGRMTQLPNGQVLFCNTYDNGLFVYTPDSGPDASWLPTISSVTANGDGSYLVKGTQLNGLSDGGNYGDDVQVASNYPLVRLTSSGGHVYYARTFNHSTMGVATGSTVVSTNFTLPAGLPTGTYTLKVVANGIASAGVSFSTGSTSPVLAKLTLSPTSVTSGTASTGTITLSAAAPAGGAVITLMSSKTSAATVPASVTVAAGATTKTFTVMTKTVTASTNVTIMATYKGVSKTAVLTVTPASTKPVPTKQVFNPNPAFSSGETIGTVTISKAAPAGGASVDISSGGSTILTLMIAAGQTSGTYSLGLPTETSTVTFTIDATLNGATVSTVLTVKPTTVKPLSLAFTPNPVKGGTTTTGTVKLTAAAPAGGALTTITQNGTALGSVLVAAGQTKTTFTFTPATVTATTSYTMGAAYNGKTVTTTLKVTP